MERVLGLPSLVLFGLAYMVPLTVFTTYGLVTQATSGHLPAAYVVTLITMLFTAYSYGRMAASLPYAGSAYAYASSTFGGKIGFMVGWVLLLDYLFIPMICYLVIGIYMAQYFPAVPMSVWICGSILGVLVLNVLGIKLLAKVNFALIGVQIVFIVVFIAASIVSISDAPPVSFSAPFFSVQISTFKGCSAVLPRCACPFWVSMRCRRCPKKHGTQRATFHAPSCCAPCSAAFYSY
nr:hypothetical protein GCM10020185_00480 [Pseudomonas brassicacearum subsp. brassicacearum]